MIVAWVREILRSPRKLRSQFSRPIVKGVWVISTTFPWLAVSIDVRTCSRARGIFVTAIVADAGGATGVAGEAGADWATGVVASKKGSSTRAVGGFADGRGTAAA